MPIDYAIGVGTFVANNAVIIHDAVDLMARTMKMRGIAHTTLECTLRGFTCSQAKVDPKVATPAEIMRTRTLGRAPDRRTHRRPGNEVVPDHRSGDARPLRVLHGARDSGAIRRPGGRSEPTRRRGDGRDWPRSISI
jgi:hypothetical protein